MATAKKKTTTKKATTKKVDTVDFSKTINTITDTAKNVNKQVMKATEAVAEDLVKQGGLIKDVAVKTVKEKSDEAIKTVKESSDVAIKTVKETYTNVTEVLSATNVKKTAKNTNKAALKTANGMVDGVIKGTEQWQGVANKAIKGGIKLADQQQDIIFTALEEMKGQVLKGANRFGRLFSKN